MSAVADIEGKLVEAEQQLRQAMEGLKVAQDLEADMKRARFPQIPAC